jgi:hypothetical protein
MKNRPPEELSVMTEAIPTAVLATTTTPGISNGILNYAIIAVVLFGVVAIMLAILVW